MKKYLIIGLILLAACAGKKSDKKTNFSSVFKKEYKVYKIDSLNKYYLIYLKRNDSLFKVVSKKAISSKCEIVKLNAAYLLQLQSLNILGGNYNSKTQGVNYLNGRNPCRKFDDSTEICLERYIGDLYQTKDIVGKCYRPE